MQKILADLAIKDSYNYAEPQNKKYSELESFHPSFNWNPENQDKLVKLESTTTDAEKYPFDKYESK